MSRRAKAIIAGVVGLLVGWLMAKYLPVGLFIIIVAWLTGVATFVLFGAVLYWWAKRRQRKRQERDEERARFREVAMEYKPPTETHIPQEASDRTFPCPRCGEFNNPARGYCRECGWLLRDTGPSQKPRPRGAEFPPLT